MSYYKENELTHWGILGMHWGVRRYQNEDGTLTEAGKRRYGDDSNSGRYPLESGSGVGNGTSSSSTNNRSDLSGVKRSSNIREAMSKSKTMSNDELRKSAERLELESRYVRAVQSQKGKSFLENVASKANTISSLMNSTNSMLQFTTGKNFAQLISKNAEDLMGKKVKDLELENKYYNELAKKNRRMKDPGSYIDWDSVIDEWVSEFE